MGKPRELRETREQDLFRSRLDQIINMEHELVRLARAIDWPVLETRFGSVYSAGPGMPPLPTRLMAGLAICVRHYLSNRVAKATRKATADHVNRNEDLGT